MVPLNWVLLLGGLIPLWTVLMIVYMNRSVAPRSPVKQVEAAPDEDYDYEPAQEKPARRSPRGPLRFVGRLRSLIRLPAGRQRVKEAPEEEQAPTEDEPQEPLAPEPGSAAVAVDFSDERRMWGATFIALACACAMNGVYLGLDYVFREYRTVIGMRLPMAGALQAASAVSLLILGALVVASSAKTGLKLLRG